MEVSEFTYIVDPVTIALLWAWVGMYERRDGEKWPSRISFFFAVISAFRAICCIAVVITS